MWCASVAIHEKMLDAAFGGWRATQRKIGG